MPAIRLEQVSFAYPQHGRGLGPLSLVVPAGQAVHVSGPSGCGKSTLARLLAGLIPHLYRGELRGQVWVNGLRPDQTPLWQLTEQVGLVFQNPAAQMLAATVADELAFGLENLGLPPAEIRRRQAQALERFGLGGLAARSPTRLSGGEGQKLALAAVLARQPPVLVLDEPLSMLDSRAARAFVDHLAELARAGTTLVICEHRHEYLQPLNGLRTFDLGLAPSRTSAGELARPEAPPPGALPGAPFRLIVSGLGVERGGQAILNGLDLELDSGQVVAIVGRNGSGKTTLLRALAGLQRFTGAIRLQSGPAAPQFGLIFQNPDVQIFNASVRQEIRYRLPQPDEAYYAWLLELLDLRRYEQTPPLLLSEGEKRRLALATVLMRRPAHGVLLDEPSLGQDPHHKRILSRALRQLAGAGQLALIATHDLELAAQADRVILLGPQGILANGPPAEVFRDQSAWEQAGLWVPDWMRVS